MSGETGKKEWTAEDGKALQEAVDRIFVPTGGEQGELGALGFSLTIADPSLQDCPLIGSSTGFCTLCGYEMSEIVGRNCRFLIDPVPKDLVDCSTRQNARDYCAAVREGKTFMPSPDMEAAWMPEGRPSDYGVFCAQTNMRKDGTLFKNMFYMRSVNLNDHTYILGLQSEIRNALDKDGRDKPTNNTNLYHKACSLLEENMAEVERVLASKFWYSGPMRRQDDKDKEDGYCGDGFNKDVWSGAESPPAAGAAAAIMPGKPEGADAGGATQAKKSSFSCLARRSCCSGVAVDTAAQVPPQKAWASTA